MYHALYLSALQGLAYAAQEGGGGPDCTTAPWFPWASLLFSRVRPPRCATHAEQTQTAAAPERVRACVRAGLWQVPRWIDSLNVRELASAAADGASEDELADLAQRQVGIHTRAHPASPSSAVLTDASNGRHTQNAAIEQVVDGLSAYAQLIDLCDRALATSVYDPAAHPPPLGPTAHDLTMSTALPPPCPVTLRRWAEGQTLRTVRLALAVYGWSAPADAVHGVDVGGFLKTVGSGLDLLHGRGKVRIAFAPRDCRPHAPARPPARPPAHAPARPPACPPTLILQGLPRVPGRTMSRSCWGRCRRPECSRKRPATSSCASQRPAPSTPRPRCGRWARCARAC